MSRPLKLAERRARDAERRRLALAESRSEITTSLAQLGSKHNELTFKQNELNRALDVSAAIADNLRVFSDRAQRNASGIALWFLSSSLASNLAGIWALMSDKSLSRGDLFNAIGWFSIGVVVSFIAGAHRLWASYKTDGIMLRWAQYAFRSSTGTRTTDEPHAGLPPEDF